jgi:hypothetical protein
LTLPSPIWSLRDEIDPLPLSIGVLLMVAMAVQLAWPSPRPSDRAAGLQAPPAPAVAPSMTPDYPQILSRSLFTPSRSAAGAGLASQAASAVLSDYTLVGVAHVGGRGEAVMRGPGGEVVSLRAGDSLLGWQVAEVGQASIVLQQGDIRRVVAVSSSAAPKTGAQ